MALPRYEWLVNCYQMRVDDDYAWGGNLRGLYDSSASGEGPDRVDIARDFYVFCRMAKENGVLPRVSRSYSFTITFNAL